jgi:hypothetical protein
MTYSKKIERNEIRKIGKDVTKNLANLDNLVDLLFVGEEVNPTSSEPLILNFYDFTKDHIFKIPPRFLRKSALNDIDTRKMMEILSNNKQITNPESQEAIKSPSVLAVKQQQQPELQKQVLAVGTKMDQILIDIRDNHYLLVFYLLKLHIYLSRLFDVTHDIKLLIIKRQIEKSLVNYERYDAAYCVQLEENNLKTYRNLPGILANIELVLEENEIQIVSDRIRMKREQRQFTPPSKPKKEGEKNVKDGGMENNTGINPNESALPNNEENNVAKVAVTTQSPDKQPPNKQPPNKQPPNKQPPNKQPPLKKTIEEKFDIEHSPRKNIQKKSESAAKWLTSFYNSGVSRSKKIRKVRTDQSTDLQDSKVSTNQKSQKSQKSQNIHQINVVRPQVMQQLPEIDLANVTEPLKALFEFGEAFEVIVDEGLDLIEKAREQNLIPPVSANVIALEDIRAKLLKYMNVDIENENFAAPVIIIQDIIRMSVVLGNYRLGEIIYSCPLTPGERQELTVRTTTRKVEEKAQSSNILTEDSQEARDSFKDSLEEQVQNSDSISTEGKKDFAASAQANYGTKNFGVSGDVKYSSSEDIKKDRKSATDTVKNSVNTHTKQTNAKKKVEITETSKQVMEKTQETGMTKILENHNLSKGLTSNFHAIYVANEAYQHLIGMKIIYSNGTSAKGCAPYKIDQLFDDILTEDAEEFRRDIKERIRDSCEVVDYQGRIFNLLESSTDGKLNVVFKPYSQYIKEAIAEGKNYAIDEIEKKLQGIILDKFEDFVKTSGIGQSTSLSKGNGLCSFRQMEAIAKINNDLVEADFKNTTTKGLKEYFSILKQIPSTRQKVEIVKVMVEGYDGLFKSIGNNMLKRIDMNITNRKPSNESPKVDLRMNDF